MDVGSARRARSRSAALLLAFLLLTGCGQQASDVVGSNDFGPEALTQCRALGGGWRYVEYRDGGGSMATVEHGPDGGMPSGKRLRRSRAAAAANGWDEAAIQTLLSLPDSNEMARNVGFTGSDAQLDAMRRTLHTRLEAMPNCDE